MSNYYSPLLFPVKLDNDVILVLDETKLPFEEVFIPAKTLEEVLKILSEMRTRAWGQVLLFFYSAVLFQGKISPKNLAQKFKEQRPTFAFNLLAEILEKETKKNKDIKEVVDSFVKNFDDKRRQRMYNVAKDLPKEAHILTICNINGEFIYLYEEMQKLNKNALFYISETRPYLQGTRLTFWELSKNNIPVRLICDNQVAYLMKQKRINAVIVGADRATIYNDIINKIGTYSLACLAKYFNIPFYALIQYPEDINIDNITIEERNPQEVFMFLDNFCLDDLDAIYPSFDITKRELVSKVYEIK